ncbi:hypothetical protein Ocin01_03887 [Orchesella cincta]|uniref:Uncharacterized protein n=1 Tax=Orchesella cincta TaxID=48709 RepID=A0A1D2NC08_ORCCI|nr:hypothetical protein Ocin01_03887 [Orchesella cincta]
MATSNRPDYEIISAPFCTGVDGPPHGTNLFFTPTTCFESRDPTAKEDLDIAVLYAEGAAKIADLKYPKEMDSLTTAFMSYDEPLYPIPVGASVFYFVLIAWITTFYFTYLGRKVLSNLKQKLDLHPESNKFPNLPLCWLQQSKRESELRREVRNTWAHLAKRYLLSPNDPLLANVDQILGIVNWHDFEKCKNTWSLIKTVLRLNALFLKIRKTNADGRRSFEILRDRDLTRVPMDGDKVQRVFEEDDDMQSYIGDSLHYQTTESTIMTDSTITTAASIRKPDDSHMDPKLRQDHIQLSPSVRPIAPAHKTDKSKSVTLQKGQKPDFKSKGKVAISNKPTKNKSKVTTFNDEAIHHEDSSDQPFDGGA